MLILGLKGLIRVNPGEWAQDLRLVLYIRSYFQMDC